MDKHVVRWEMVDQVPDQLVVSVSNGLPILLLLENLIYI